MNITLFFKRVDFIAQIVALLAPLIFVPICTDILNTLEWLICCYVSVGSAQTISSFLNYIYLPEQYRHRHRLKYGRVLLAIFIVAGIQFMIGGKNGSVLIFLGILFFAAPVLAVWYAIITFSEMDKISGEGEII